jgi:hypothetical protein
MCQPAAMVLTESAVHWRGESDSHEHIIKAAGLIDDKLPPDIVRVEVVPPDGDMTRPLSEWIYHVDQDVMPTWYSAAREEARARGALPEWFVACVIASGEHDTIGAETRYLCGSANVGRLECGQTLREMWGSSQVGAMWGSSQVGEMRGSSQVGEMRGSSQVRAMWGSSQVREMRDSSQVREMWGSSQVGAMRDSSQVRAMRDSSVVTKCYPTASAVPRDRAVAIDRSVDPPVVYCGWIRPDGRE